MTETWYDLMPALDAWLASGVSAGDILVTRLAETAGFSSREPAAVGLRAPGRPGLGSRLCLLEGADTNLDRLVSVTVGEDDAAAVGLACGGRARLLTQRLGDLPSTLLPALRDKRAACLVTELDGEVAIGTRHYGLAEMAEAGERYGREVGMLFSRGAGDTRLLSVGGDGSPAPERALVTVLWPVPRLVVVGEGLIVEALQGIAATLGWQVTAVTEVEEAVTTVGELSVSDAVVVLSHHREVDGPTLTAALHSATGYVGALGSRRTQAARREWLTAHGVDASLFERIHGPAGIDLGARTAGEIAVSIVAEILQTKSQATAAPLASRTGPIHEDGLNAPPPRYPLP